MSEKKYAKVGKVHSAQGIKGEIFVYIFAEESTWLKKLKTLFLGPKESREPDTQLAIERKRQHQKQGKPGLAIKLKDVNDRNGAEELIGCDVYVPGDFLVSKKGEKIFLGEILNFKVTDQARGDVGTIVDFMANGAQDLIVVAHPNGERFEVPLVKPILVSIDFEKEIVLMDIPEGLVAGEEL